MSSRFHLEAPQEDPGFLTWSGLDVPSQAIKTLGDFELLERIGRGGMGNVYRARQKGMDRDVAVKLVSREALLVDPAAAERLRREARLVGRLRHPNIVPVYEVGEVEGQAYFAMELVVSEDGNPAPTLATLVAGGPLAFDRTARYVAVTARAVAAAHAEKILHRDLKPSNVLVGAGDRIAITDFGLATHLQNSSSRSSTRSGCGTPGYAPPEQVTEMPIRPSFASDVYGLGAILYYLLTLCPPFEGSSPADTTRLVLDEEPQAPREINERVPADLETICLKCLEKEPARRYPSALSVAEDLERFLRHEPILARPASQAERLRKWCRRKPQVAAWVATSLILFFVAFAISVFLGLRAEEGRREAEHAYGLLALSRTEEYLSSGDSGTALASLAEVLSRYPKNATAAQRAASLLCFARIPRVMELPRAKERPVSAMAFNGPETVLGLADDSGSVELWSLSDRQLQLRLSHSSVVRGLDFDPTSNRLLTLTSDGSIHLWDLQTGVEIREPKIYGTNAIIGAGWADQGRYGLSLLADGTVRVWNRETLDDYAAIRSPTERIASVTGRPGLDRIRTVSNSGTVSDWNAKTGELLSTEPSGTNLNSLTASSSALDSLGVADWQLLSVSEAGIWGVVGRESQLQFMSLEQPGVKTPVASFRTPIHSVAINRPGSAVVVLTDDGGAYYLFRQQPSTPKRIPLEEGVVSIQSSASGEKIAAVGYSGTVRWWETRGRPSPAVPLLEDRAAITVRLTKQQDLALILEDSGQALLKTLFSVSPQTIALGEPKTRGVTLSARGNLIALRDSTGSVVLHHRNSAWQPMASLELPKRVQRVVISEDEQHLLTLFATNVWEWTVNGTNTPTLAAKFRHSAAVLACDYDQETRLVATLTKDGIVRLWPAKGLSNPQELHLNISPHIPLGPDSIVRFLPNRREILAIGGGKTRLWNFSSGTPTPQDLGEMAGVEVVAHAVSDSSDRFALAMSDSTVRVYGTRTRATPMQILRTPHLTTLLHFCYDGSLLLLADAWGDARLWDVPAGIPATASFKLMNPLADIQLSHDGRYLIAAGSTGVQFQSTTRMSVPVPEWFPEFLQHLEHRTEPRFLSPQRTQHANKQSQVSQEKRGEADWGRLLNWFEEVPAEPISWIQNPF